MPEDPAPSGAPQSGAELLARIRPRFREESTQICLRPDLLDEWEEANTALGEAKVKDMSSGRLATGISAVRHGALPRWLAWTSVVLGVLFFTPVFWVEFFIAPLWFLVVSIWGIRHELDRGAAPAAPVAPAAA
jgi:hypothetical protein